MMKLLLADDSPLLRENLQKLMRPVDTINHIYESEDVPATIEAIDTNKPEVIILDIRMPGGSGFDVLEHLKQRQQSPIVIVLTNYATDYNREKCFRLGAKYFFDKTKEFEKVIDVLKTLKL
jgi:DNA-binding NarL/FixJ family response regulator